MLRSLLLPFAAFALQASGIAMAQSSTSGCGSTSIKYDVHASKTHTFVKPDSGKAVVYLIQDDLNFNNAPDLTTRFGVDGQWAGATHARSYFFITVAPGEHDLCADWQNLSFARGPRLASVHLTAEAGGIYFFEARNTRYPGETSFVPDRIDVTLSPLDANEGKILISSYKESTSQPKS